MCILITNLFKIGKIKKHRRVVYVKATYKKMGEKKTTEKKTKKKQNYSFAL